MIKRAGTTLIMPRGDTGTLAFVVKGVELTDADRGVFALYDPDEAKALRIKTQVFVDNVAVIRFVNEDTEDLEAKDYCWDFRLVIGAKIDGKGNVSDGVEVHSKFAMNKKLPEFRLREVGVHV